MAGDWIKMRPSLITSPKVNGIARELERSVDVGRALSTGYNGVMSDVVTRNVMRNVTVSALLTVWGAANEHTVDGVFRNADLSDIDDMVGIPGFGEAMVSVGWAIFDDEEFTVTLPNFNEYNTSGKERGASSKTNAERQREYRKRKKQDENRNEIVTTNNVTSDVTRNHREEKRREDKEYTESAPDSLQAKEVLEHLNASAGRAYRAVESTLKPIIARLKSGATVEQCKAVVDAKVAEWGGDEKMEAYLRPETLFGATKFEQYLGQLDTQPARQERPWI